MTPASPPASGFVAADRASGISIVCVFELDRPRVLATAVMGPVVLRLACRDQFHARLALPPHHTSSATLPHARFLVLTDFFAIVIFSAQVDIRIMEMILRGTEVAALDGLVCKPARNAAAGCAITDADVVLDCLVDSAVCKTSCGSTLFATLATLKSGLQAEGSQLRQPTSTLHPQIKILPSTFLTREERE